MWNAQKLGLHNWSVARHREHNIKLIPSSKPYIYTLGVYLKLLGCMRAWMFIVIRSEMPRNIVPAFEYIGFSAYFVFCVFFFPFPFCFSSYSVSSICWHSYYVPFIEQSRRHKPLLSGVIMPAIRKHKMYAHVHISPDVDEVCSWPQQYFDFHFNRFANNSMTSTATGNCSPV